MGKKIRFDELFVVGSAKRVLKSQWKKEGVPFYRGREVTKLSINGSVNNQLFISKEHYKELKNKHGVPNVGDIIITAIGTIGNAYIVKENDEFYFKDASVLWLKKKSNIISKYVSYFIKSDIFKSQLDNGNGATVDTLTIKKLASIEIEVPILSEQQRIVAKLDAVIAEIDKIADTEFKKNETTKFLIEKINDNIFNKLKNNSKSAKLSSIIKFENGDRGKNYPSKKYQLSVGIPFINAGDLSLDGEITQKGMVYISEDRFNLLGAGKVELDDILFCLRGSLGKCALNKTYKKGAIASSLVIMRPEKKKILPKYLLAYLRSGLIKELIRNTAGGTAQPNLSAKTVSNYEIPLPSIEMQELVLNKIEIIKEEYFKLRKIISQKRDELGKLKSSIFLKLLNKAA